MRDQDLTLPVILGLEFLMDSGIQIDFKDKTYILSEESEGKHPFILDESSTTISLHLALPLVKVSSSTLATIKELASRADVLKTQKGQLEALMLDRPTVCTDALGRTAVIQHEINTTDEIPVRKRAYPVSVVKQQFIDQDVSNMLEKGIIRPSTSSWAAPIVLVPKKDGTMRFCIDYRALNAKTPLDGFPMPQIQDILESMYGASIFSTLDLRSGYWQVLMDEASIPKTAFVTKNSQYEFVCLPVRIEKLCCHFSTPDEYCVEGLSRKVLFCLYR